MFDSAASTDFRLDRKRIAIVLTIVAALGIANWFALPAIQRFFIPRSPDAIHGPWIVRPITAFRFCAMAVLSGVTYPFIYSRLQKRWSREDAESGEFSEPPAWQSATRTWLLARAALLFVIYLAGLLFYLLSWSKVGPDGIESHLPWTVHRHSFEEVVALETIPQGQRSESITQNGPWFRIKFQRGNSLDLSLENEGMTEEELDAVTSYIAKRSGRQWESRRDTRTR